jgi:hypothetical protein
VETKVVKDVSEINHRNGALLLFVIIVEGILEVTEDVGRKGVGV